MDNTRDTLRLTNDRVGFECGNKFSQQSDELGIRVADTSILFMAIMAL